MQSDVQSGIAIALRRLAPLSVLVAALSPGLAQAAARLDLLPQRWTDDLGRELKLSELRGRRVILTMAYASCHYICPMTLDGLQRMQQELDSRGEQASIIVIGYDPKNDKPSDWHHYRMDHQLGRANWYFLSGTEQVTRDLAWQLGFGFWKYDDHVMHESRVVVFGTDGSVQFALNTPTADWPSVL